MAARTYKPGLRRIARLFASFVTRYQQQMLQHMDPAEALALAAAQAAIDELLAEIDEAGGQ